ncbi:hypothetical protein [Frankia sp. AvcI1]|uniref:hypothetical protein n=1 Tax=Frankia sp. AvcI1 TaxID=573496 RepID=UPI00211803C5|nr:hypothetical protein [Frankia sp. AvcI1]
MGTRWALPALAIAVGLAAAGCGGESSPATTAATSAALTPYQRAYPVICQGATTAPPTDAPTTTSTPQWQQVAWQQVAWRQGFCLGDAGVRMWEVTPTTRTVALAGNAARLALVTSPPDCLIVRGTPAAPFCP